MNARIEDAVKRTLLRPALRDLQLWHWKRLGKPVPPPNIVKQKAVKGYARRFSIRFLIETGTYLGDMVDATRNCFDRIISIELDEALFRQAQARFAPFQNVSILQGNSGEVLPRVLTGLTTPCIFWLDAHYSGGGTAKGDQDTPIMQELNHLLAHPLAEKHVILIDDARLFTGENDYPPMRNLELYIRSKTPAWTFEVADDIIRIYKAQ